MHNKWAQSEMIYHLVQTHTALSTHSKITGAVVCLMQISHLHLQLFGCGRLQFSGNGALQRVSHQSQGLTAVVGNRQHLTLHCLFVHPIALQTGDRKKQWKTTIQTNVSLFWTNRVKLNAPVLYSHVIRYHCWFGLFVVHNLYTWLFWWFWPTFFTLQSTGCQSGFVLNVRCFCNF